MSEARQLPIFQGGGRAAFFGSSDLHVMLCDGRGGLLPTCSGGSGFVPLLLTLLTSAIGAWALTLLPPRRAKTVYLALGALVVAGLVLALFAWAVLFKAHLPSRYRIVSVDLAIAIGVASIVAVVAVWLAQRVLLGLAVDRPAERQLEHDPAPAISDHLRATAKDALVAGLPDYIGSVPAFAARSVWVAPELTVPYKADYLSLMEARAETLMQLLQGPLDDRWREVLDRSGIDYMVIEVERTKASTGPRALGRWPGTFVAARTFLQDGNEMPPTVFDAYPQATETCRKADGGNLALIDLRCFAAAVP
jgi:hypothetical protein